VTHVLPTEQGESLHSRGETTPQLWIAGLVGAMGWAATASVLAAGRKWTLDLQVYRGAGHRLLEGADPFVITYTSLHLPFYYPPFAVVVLRPLSVLPLTVAQVLWCLLAAFAIVGTLVIGLRAVGVEQAARWVLALAIGGACSIFEPIRSGLGLGQIDALLMVMVMVDLLSVRGRGRGVLTGLASAIKLTPLYFVLFFVVSRDWRALRNSLLSFTVVTGVSWVFLPSESNRYFFHELFDPTRYHVGGLGSVSNQAWSGVLSRSPFVGSSGSTYIWIVVCALTTAIVVWLCKLLVRRSALETVVVLALGSLLVSPISWSHHWCWIVLLPLVSWQRRRDRIFLTLSVLMLAVTASGAYSHFRDGVSRSIASSVLVLLTAALLAWWLHCARKENDQELAPGRCLLTEVAVP
jgi:alpha-1,2-mannosyltransferase